VKLLKLKMERIHTIDLYKERKIMTIMCKEKTLKEIENMPDENRKLQLKYIIKNCSSYMVTPDENEHWLCGNTILTKWSHDTGYSRKYYGFAYPDNFEHWNFHTDILASEAFDEHHELENY